MSNDPDPFPDETTAPDSGALAAPHALQEARSPDPMPDVDPANGAGSEAQETSPLEAAQTYRVTGPHPVLGTPSGETFTAVISPGQEAFLVEAGHIELVGPPTETTEASS